MFSKRLRELRRSSSLTQKEVAQRIGTNNSSICDWERGRTEPGIADIIKLCKLFDVTADYLLGITPY